jgi:SAM-dependent methyltransferase
MVEADHYIQNPTSPDKIRLLGDYLRLTSDSRVLDLACGKAGPALILASTYGCRIVGVERLPAFAAEARARIAAQGLASLIEVETGDAADFPIEHGAWDAVLCLGASFVWGTIADAAAVLVPGVRRAGFLAIGEPFWRRWPLPHEVEQGDFVDLEATVVRFEQAGVSTTGLIAASEDDWDHYESLHWRAVEEWLAEHADDPDAEDIRSRHERSRSEFVAYQRALLGWAIFVGRKA